MSGGLKSAYSVKIGKKFAKNRDLLGYSIEEVSNILVINKSYLQAIEKGIYDVFPSESFAKAYFIKYQNFLKISQEFPDVFNFKSKKTQIKIPKEINFSQNRDLFLILIALGLIITIIFGIYFFIKTIDSSYEESIEKEIKDTNTQSLDEIENQDNKEIPDLKYEENTVLYEEIIDNNMLELEFTGECWIEIYLDKKIIEAQLFNDGDKYKREIERPYKIIIGNADYVKGTYNGIDIDFITDANRLTRVNTVNFINE